MKPATHPTTSRHRRRLRPTTLVPAVAVALLGGLLLGPPGQAIAGDPDPAQNVGSYTVFNTPSESGEPDYTVENHLVDLVDEAPAGSEIQGAKFSWTRTPVAEALARAQERGVDVSLAIDGEGHDGVNADPDNEAMAILRDADLTELVFCGDESSGNSACIGNRSGSINHNKIFTFSETGDMTDAVLVSSQNLTNSQNSLHNAATVIHEEPELHEAFGRHMGNLLAQEKDNDYYTSDDGYFRSPLSDIRVFFSPRADSNGGTEPEASTDLVVGRLSYITEYEDGCSVDVAHAQFTGPRQPVADELIRIGELGCEVRIAAGDNMTDYISDHLAGRTNITIRRLDELHSKYIIYQGNYNGTAGRELVFSGSHNLTGPALRSHDETLIRTEFPNVTDDYRENFDMLWERAS